MKKLTKTIASCALALTLLVTPAASLFKTEPVTVSAATYSFMAENSSSGRRTVYFHPIGSPWIIYRSCFYCYDGYCLEIYDWDTGRLMNRFHDVVRYNGTN